MASTIKGITVKIGGDTVDLKKALEGTTKTSKNLQSELNQVNKLLKFNPDNAALLAQKQELLAEKTGAAREALKKLKDVQDDVERQAKSGEISGEQYRAYQREVEQTQSVLKHLETQLKETGDKFNEVQRKSGDMNFRVADDKLQYLKDKFHDFKESALKDMEEVSDSFKKTGEGIEKVGSFLNKGSAVAGAALVGGTKFAMDFEDAMAKVSTIADENEVPMDKLRQQILDLSNETGVAATDIAENVYNAISAGQDTADAVNFVAQSLSLSKAGFSDTGAALDVLTTIMNAYGMSAEEVGNISDMLIQTQNLGKVTVGELASSMGKVIPTANQYGVSLDQLAAAYSITTAKGIAAAESTTYINSMINELGKSDSKASKALKEGTGKTFTELMEEGKSLSDVLAILQENANENNKSLGDMFGSAEAAKAASTLLGDSAKEFNDRLQEMNNSTGATDEALGKLKTTSSDTKKIVNELKNAGIDLGQEVLVQAAPILKEVMDGVKNVTKWLKKLSPEQKKVLTKAIEIAAVAGPAVTITGKLVKGIGDIVGVLPKAVNAIKGMTAATKGAEAAQVGLNTAQSASPVGALIALLGLVAAAITTYYMTTDEAARKALFMTDAEAELNERLMESKQKWDDLNEAQQEQSKEAETQYSYYDSLLERLEAITDETGKIKEGYEKEAKTITDVLNDAFDMEIEITDGVIQNYQDMQKELTNLIALERAKAQQDAFSDKYKEALNDRRDAWEQIGEAEDVVKEYDEKITELREKRARLQNQLGRWEQTSTGRKWIADEQKQREYDGLQTAIDFEISQRDKAKKTVEERQRHYLELLNTIQNYENVTSAIASKDSDLISDAVNRMVNEFVTADNATEEMLKSQLTNAEENLASLKKAYDEGAPGVTSAMVDEAISLVAMSKAELEKLPDAAKKNMEQTGDDAYSGFKNSIDRHKNDFEKEGEASAGAYFDGFDKEAGINSPSVEMYKRGKFFVQGFINGLRDGTGLKNLWDTAKSVASTALDAIKSFLGIHSPSKEAQKLGAFFGEGFSDGIHGYTKEAALSAAELAEAAQKSLKRVNLQSTFSSLSALKNSPYFSNQGTGNISNVTTNNNPTIHVTVNAQLNSDADINALTDKIANQLGRKVLQDGRKWG
jgi:TP901 family phage tail tape measure protein